MWLDQSEQGGKGRRGTRGLRVEQISQNPVGHWEDSDSDSEDSKC